MRNSIYSEGKSVTNPATIVCYACSLMSYWAGLLMVANKDALVAGVNTMLAIAVKLMTKKKAKQGQLLLKDGQNDDQDR
jgi:spore maturation protein SpmA